MKYVAIVVTAILFVLILFSLDQHAELSRQREARALDAQLQSSMNKQRAKETEDYLRESSCKDAVEKYGIESEVSKQHCPGTKFGKQVGF